ncbi:hypothetical protein GGF32_003531 [Allomyces javanicus]|nr:hypothetical protein GGF32_003531 [Allomyces javanicus]
MRDMELIWPHLPLGLHTLCLNTNRLDALQPSFPPAFRVLSVAYNASLDDATCWIDALSSALRQICVDGCCLDDDAGRRLLGTHNRAGAWRQTREVKMKVRASGNQFSKEVRHALEAERLCEG